MQFLPTKSLQGLHAPPMHPYPEQQGVPGPHAAGFSHNCRHVCVVSSHSYPQQHLSIPHVEGLMHEVHFPELALNPQSVGHEPQPVPENSLHGLHSPTLFPGGTMHPQPGQHRLVELHPATGFWHKGVLMHLPPQHVNNPDPVLHSHPAPPSNAVPVDALLSQSLHPSKQVPNGGEETDAVLHAPPKQALFELVVLQSQSPSKSQSE